MKWIILLWVLFFAVRVLDKLVNRLYIRQRHKDYPICLRNIEQLEHENKWLDHRIRTVCKPFDWNRR